MRIRSKAFFLILLLSSVLLGCFAIFMQWSVAKGMVDYVNALETEQLQPLISELANHYQEHRSWSALEDNHFEFKQILRYSLQDSALALPEAGPLRRGKDLPRIGRKPPPHRRIDQKPPIRRDKLPQVGNGNAPLMSFLLADKDKNYVVGRQFDSEEYRYLPISIAEQVVGYLGVSKRGELTAGYELNFVEQQQQVLWIVVTGLLALAIIIAFPIARHLLNPVKELTQGMHRLTQGDYEQTLSTTRKDELGQLARDFNELSSTLKENNQARQRWLANIAHELRTPVAILKGELEAILDGIRPFDQDNAQSLHQEIAHLQQLIEDLHALTSADIGGMSYRKTHLDLTSYLSSIENKYSSYLTQHNMSFSIQLPSNSAVIFADETRLNQLIDNLLNNAVKYAGEGSRVNLALSVDGNAAKLVIEDSGEGVAEQHLPLLFEHLYRVDSARTNVKQGAGLGLSICAHIVQGHNGEISAARSSLGGLAVIITIPLIK